MQPSRATAVVGRGPAGGRSRGRAAVLSVGAVSIASMRGDEAFEEGAAARRRSPASSLRRDDVPGGDHADAAGDAGPGIAAAR